jgi:hypothetical protein
MFDATAFTQTAYDEQTSTKAIQVPEGEYIGVITKIAPREIELNGEKQVVVDLYWDVDDPSGYVKSITKRDKNNVRQTLWLDVNEGGRLDMSPGMNAQLGQTREALGQNDPGKPWSFNSMLGIPARITVVHKLNGDELFANVKKVVKV